LKITANVKRVIAFVSDLHVFSRYGLNPPRFFSREGIDFEIGEEQRKIYDFWIEFCKVCDSMKVDTVFVVGDLLHGQNVIERGAQLISPNLDEQEDAAKEILHPIVYGIKKGMKRRKLYAVAGSHYHISTPGHNPEKDVIESLGGTFFGNIVNMIFPPSNRVFNISHGVSSAYIYRETLLGREGTFIREAQALGKIPKIDCFVRGHWHSYIHIHEKKLHMIQLPGWVAYEPSKPFLRSYGRMQGDIGGVIVILDEDDRIVPWHFLMSEQPHICDKIIYDQNKNGK